jgi:3-methyladenine DNA glycosylase AlkD
VFLAPAQMLPLVANCVADHRKYVELAVGWVLRELGHAHPDAVTAFLERHAACMSSRAYTRAIERRTPAERAQLLAIRKARAG